VQELDHQDVTTKFKSHAFITLQGGAQYTLGEAKFKDLISPNVQLGIGYQFNPLFAARIQANGWQSKGGWNSYAQHPFTYTYKWNYVAPGLDLMFDLTNLIGGWNPDRFLSVVLFVGGGTNIAWKNDEANAIAANVQQFDDYKLEYLWDGTKVRPFGRGGLQLGFRLSDAVSLLLEGNANILGDKYNSKKADNPDWYFNALAGLRINLGKTKLTETKDVYRDVVVYDTIYKYVQEPVIPKKEQIRRDVFFTINSTVITDAEMQKVKEIAEYLNKYPEAKVVVSGYADKGTGNERINARLAAQRADVVVNTLKKDYGIADNRITYDSYGDKVQPFEENDLNRVSICVAE
jgi:outer membrane protein OmpA-like peptidoglycan-associated protein